MRIALKFSLRTPFSTRTVNYYKVLGLDSSATPQQIKDRYLKLAKKLHPDVVGKSGGKDDTHERFARINEAYEVLKDEAQRREHDERLAAQEGGQAQANQNVYEEASRRDERAQRDRFYRTMEEQQGTTIQSKILRLAALLLVFPSIYFFFKTRKIPTQTQIRRGNMILSLENIDSRPSTIETRHRYYMQEMKRKQFRIVEFERELNRYGNAFISEDHMKDPNKRGKTYTTIRKKKGALEKMKGVSKKKPTLAGNLQNSETYM